MSYHLTPTPQNIRITIWVGTANQRDLDMETAPNFTYSYNVQDPLESRFIPRNTFTGTTNHPVPTEGLTLRDCGVEIGSSPPNTVHLVWFSPDQRKYLVAFVIVTKTAGLYPSDDVLLSRKRANRAIERAGGKPSQVPDPELVSSSRGLRYIRAYCIARGSGCSANLVTQVNAYIKGGWLPQGGLIKDDKGCYYQALVRYS